MTSVYKNANVEFLRDFDSGKVTWEMRINNKRRRWITGIGTKEQIATIEKDMMSFIIIDELSETKNKKEIKILDKIYNELFEIKGVKGIPMSEIVNKKSYN